MEANKEEIAKKYSLLLSSGVRHVTQPGMLAAMEEYATSKLHLLQQEFQAAYVRNKELSELYHSLLDKYNKKEQEYDKLKGEKVDWLDIAGTASRKYNELWVEHHDLKEKAEKMAKALQHIADLRVAGIFDSDRTLDDARDVANDALSSYNSTNNQNENNG